MESGIGRGRGRGRGVSGSEVIERVDLRRPHVPPPQVSQAAPPVGIRQTSEGTAATPGLQEEVKPKKTFSLSAEAPEFVPRTFVQPQPQPPKIQMPVTTQNIPHQVTNPVVPQPQPPKIQMPVTTQNIPHQVTNPVVPQPQIQYMCHPVVLQVNNLVVQLTIKPNKFDQVARQLTTILSWQVQDAFLMKEVITVIFEQGVGEVNFRYSGARLCQHLSKNITQSYNGPTFKSLLLQRCHEEFNVREMYMQSEPSRVCGFTLFLAELFTQLVTTTAQPLEVLGPALCQLLMTLLTQTSDSNLKCAAQVLKFTGSSLDTLNRNDMEQVINTVKDVAMTAPVAAGTRSLLLAVVELRAANWGRGPPSPDQSPTSTPTHSNVPMGTVYYGPGGVIQRVEEEPEDSASDTDDVANLGWSPAVEELEGDVADAFEEFLRLQQ
ncbi:polyadenylate-binding protein-interacting protein 1-like [Penaeus monodon]|uniref:polyadenylate-binding protein-interacting protein 1-like n=1 Tax=Penaeus monodon TaxID=6687 RepID=UPI0018A6FD58|nr:polyadenylate-binding protein-interacting protein 1-like [Penaeus monodon]